VVVGWTDRASPSHIGALLLGYYTEVGRLHSAGRASTGMTAKELKRSVEVLAPLQMSRAPAPAAREEAASCCSNGMAFRSGRAEHNKQ
jgi:bifunctional non-homologous end joining protein LigD